MHAPEYTPIVSPRPLAADGAPPLLITIHAQLGGFPVDVAFTGHIAQIAPAIVKLRAAGLDAPAPHVTTVALMTPSGATKPPKPAALRTAPLYTADGAACCPVHKVPLRSGQYSQFCPSRADGEHANDKGYCRYTHPND